MSRLLLVSIFLIFYADPSRSLPQSVIREFTGLDSKANRFVLPVNPINGTAASIPNPLANISKCQHALIKLSESPLVLAACKYIFFPYYSSCSIRSDNLL